jgi:hypothetical protein
MNPTALLNTHRHCLAGLATSSTGRVSRAVGPIIGWFRIFGVVFDQTIEFLARSGGVFRPMLPPTCTCAAT